MPTATSHKITNGFQSLQYYNNFLFSDALCQNETDNLQQASYFSQAYDPAYHCGPLFGVQNNTLGTLLSQAYVEYQFKLGLNGQINISQQPQGPQSDYLYVAYAEHFSIQ